MSRVASRNVCLAGRGKNAHTNQQTPFDSSEALPIVLAKLLAYQPVLGRELPAAQLSAPINPKQRLLWVANQHTRAAGWRQSPVFGAVLHETGGDAMYAEPFTMGGRLRQRCCTHVLVVPPMIHELTHRRHISLIARAHRCATPREGVVRKDHEGKPSEGSFATQRCACFSRREDAARSDIFSSKRSSSTSYYLHVTTRSIRARDAMFGNLARGRRDRHTNQHPASSTLEARAGSVSFCRQGRHTSSYKYNFFQISAVAALLVQSASCGRKTRCSSGLLH